MDSVFCRPLAAGRASCGDDATLAAPLAGALFFNEKQTEFTSRLGVPHNRWSNCETGGARMGLNTALILCRKFGVSLDWLYLGKEGMMPHHLVLKIAELEREEGAQTAAS